jgi:hypothetical protein
MRPTLLLLPVLATACVFPNYRASKVVDLTLPAADVTMLDCSSHNGAITVTGDPGAKDIAVHAELSVRGTSQAEADANLHLLAIGQERDGTTLRLFGKYPSAELMNRSPAFKFTLKVPQRLALKLVSHNGDITANEVEGAMAIETHNGDIGGSLHTNHLAATTHNGDISLRLAGAGSLDGSVASHNGDIDLAFASGIGTRLEASTHNGKVTPPAMLQDAVVGKRRLQCNIGDGKGKLVVDTHNGDVVVR